MKLTHKLKKFADPELGITLKRALLRLAKPLPMRQFLRHVDVEQLKQIQEKYAEPGNGVRWTKFVNTPHFLKMNIRRAQNLGLDRKPPMHILDIGSGAGYFLFVCKVLGHTGMGMDLAEPKLYDEMFRLFGLQRTIGRIDKFQPIPDTGGKKYDLITAFAIVFNNHSKDNPWDEAEWDYFLEDAYKNLNPGGQVFLNLNPHPKTGAFYTPALKNYFLRKGAKIEFRCNLIFPKKKSQ